MKNKIIVFRILAADIALGGAFASVTAKSNLPLTSAYVRYSTSSTSTTCTFVGFCDRAGTAPCRVRVIFGGVSVTIPALVTLDAQTATCATAIAGSYTTGNPISTKVLPDDANIH